MKHLIRIASLFILLTLILNFRWVHAASATLLAEPCDHSITGLAQARVTELFGASNSRPILRCTKKALLGLQVSHGRTNFAPLLPAIVLIGPQGENVDVIAHEWAHAEISDRLGFFRRTIRLPVWVDEGLAMQVDRREEYSLAALATYRAQSELHWPTTDAISNSSFFAPSTQGKLHYTLSRCAVGAWQAQSNDWLNALTENLPRAIAELTEQFEECT